MELNQLKSFDCIDGWYIVGKETNAPFHTVVSVEEVQKYVQLIQQAVVIFPSSDSVARLSGIVAVESRFVNIHIYIIVLL